MAEPEEAALPLGPRARRMLEQNRNRTRARQQRRMTVSGVSEPEVIGRANDSGRSEIDFEAPRTALAGLAQDVTQAAGQALAPQPSNPLPPSPFTGTPPPAQDDEQARRARVDAAMAPLSPEQRSQVQSLPTVGYEDSEENEDALIGAAARAQGTPVAPRTQLRAPMGGAAPTASTPLRAPAVTAELPPPEEDFEDIPLGAPAPGVRKTLATTPNQGLENGRYAHEDAADRTQSEQIAEQRRRAQIASIFTGLLGQSPDVARAMVAPYDPQAPYTRRAEQRNTEREAANEDWRHVMEERRAAIEDRRIAQAEAATAEHARRTSAEFDADSQNADAMRATYNAIINGLPEEAARILQPWVDLDIDDQNATSLAQTIAALRGVIDDERKSNPRAFRQGQRTGGRRGRGRLGMGGGGGGVDYGYGANARGSGPVEYDPAQGEPPTVVDAQGQVRPTVARPVGGGSTRTQRPQATQAAPLGRPSIDLRRRAPTPEEILQDPDLARHEYAIRGLANRMNVDIGTPEGRAAAASAYNSGLGEGAEDQLYMTGAGGEGATRRTRTPEQQREVDQFVGGYGNNIRTEAELAGLSSLLKRTLRQPNGATIVRLALHGSEGIAREFAALSPQVTDLRAQMFQFINPYMSRMSGATVTPNELMRIFSAFGAGTAIADPNAFMRSIDRFRANEEAIIRQGITRYPEGARLYYEEAE